MLGLRFGFVVIMPEDGRKLVAGIPLRAEDRKLALGADQFDRLVPAVVLKADALVRAAQLFEVDHAVARVHECSGANVVISPRANADFGV